MFESLDDGLGDHDVHSLLDAGHCDFVVRVIGSEDDGHISRLVGGDGIHVCLWVNGVVRWGTSCPKISRLDECIDDFVRMTCNEVVRGKR
eukprot:CCRYP_006008-RB/>CCRYP_006008-RB protein AED:0.47 eAED:1.00 QI:0/0/0/1/0/0/2/0/89